MTHKNESFGTWWAAFKPQLRVILPLLVLAGCALSLLLDASNASWVAAALVGVAGLRVSDAWALRRRAAQLHAVMDRVAAGDLSKPVVEAGLVDDDGTTRRVEVLQQAWSRLVANVRSESELVSSAGERMTRDARALSSRSEEQAASLEQTAASVSELAASVQRNAEDAGAANRVADGLRAQVERSLNVVERAVDSVQRIEERSVAMSQIIGAIDGIAFQTNILALNAAVEAARAGESGRGFAVVASEVRILSQRTAQAAAEVKQMIEGSKQEVETGVAQIREVNDLLGAMVEGVRAVAHRIEQVAASTSQQSNSLDEIAQAVRSVDDLTQRNALMVDESVQAAEALRQQAENLKQGVKSMRLRQGCADEAREMAQRAVQCIAAHGLERAITQFHDPKGAFRDRDLFVILLDRRGHFKAFGADPSKANKPAVLPPGVDVEATVRGTLAVADAGGGWFEFRSWHPVNKTPVDKMSYVLPVGQDVVMVSANKSDGGEAPRTPPAAPSVRAPQPAARPGAVTA